MSAPRLIDVVRKALCDNSDKWVTIDEIMKVVESEYRQTRPAVVKAQLTRLVKRGEAEYDPETGQYRCKKQA